MQLHLQPPYAGAHGLQATVRHTNAILLRVRRPRDASTSASSAANDAPQIEFVGHVTRRVDFAGLADFQFPRERALLDVLPTLAQHVTSPPATEDESATTVRESLQIAPTQFTRFDMPRVYRCALVGHLLAFVVVLFLSFLCPSYSDNLALLFQNRLSAPAALLPGTHASPADTAFYSNFITLPGVGRNATAGASGAGGFRVVPPRAPRVRGPAERQGPDYISYEATDPVPSAPAANQAWRADDASSPVVARLRALFAARPVWSRLALLHQFDRDDDLLAALRYVSGFAYKFNKGPWRWCYVRYGYDPRRQPEARFLQSVDFRLSNAAAMVLNIGVASSDAAMASLAASASASDNAALRNVRSKTQMLVSL